MPKTIIAILAYNEQRRIARCLESLPLEQEGIEIHVIVNGTSDRTAEIARGFAAVTVHDYPQGGKSRSWNRFVLDTPGIAADSYVFVDGDAEVAPGSVDALIACLAQHPEANAASGLPLNGRRAGAYRRSIVAVHGLFGDLYALRGSFVERMRAQKIRLPEDLIGDDGLVCALAKTDLGHEDDWQDERVAPCDAAGFLCEPTTLTLASLGVQYRRMINYSVRHFQNLIVTDYMRGGGPATFPIELKHVYPQYLPRFTPRANPAWWWFDRQALQRMARDCAA